MRRLASRVTYAMAGPRGRDADRTSEREQIMTVENEHRADNKTLREFYEATGSKGVLWIDDRTGRIVDELRSRHGSTPGRAAASSAIRSWTEAKRTAKSSSMSAGFHGFSLVLAGRSALTASSGSVGSVTTLDVSPSRRRGSEKATSSFEPALKRSIRSSRRGSPGCRRRESGSRPTAATVSR
jgi:hypothetical protein